MYLCILVGIEAHNNFTFNGAMLASTYRHWSCVASTQTCELRVTLATTHGGGSRI